MIVCTNCGHHNPDGTRFCEVCDEYLAWSGEKVAEEPEPEPETEPETEPEPKGIVERVVDRLSPERPEQPERPERPERPEGPERPERVETSATSEAPEREEAPGHAESPARAQRPQERPAIHKPVTPSSTSSSEPPGSRPDSADPPTSSAPPTVGATKPTEVRRRRKPKKTTVEQRQRLRRGDVVCVKCGTGNDPAHNFCKKCGFTLEDARPVPEPPWWKRLFQRRRPTYEAGFRPGRGAGGRGAAAGARTARRKVRRTVGAGVRLLASLALVAGALGVSVGPWRDATVEWLSERFDAARQIVAPSFEPLTPQGAAATSAQAEHPPEDAIDLGSNTWWSEDAPGNGVGEALTVTFAEPVDIAVIGIIPGVGEQEQFVQQPRPRVLHVVFDNGTTTDLALTDAHEFQTFEIDGAQGVRTVEFQIDAVWPGQSGDAVAITEIEFRTRS